jgi:hypothetical protein
MLRAFLIRQKRGHGWRLKRKSAITAGGSRGEREMKCPYCGRHVRMFAFDPNRPLRLILSRCHACHRYVVTWLHALFIGLLVTAGIILLLEVL